MHCGMLGVGEEQVTGAPVSEERGGNRRRQLLIAELPKQIQRVLPRRKEMLTKCLHLIVMMRIDIVLIPLLPPRHSLLPTHSAYAGWQRSPGEREAQEKLNILFVGREMRVMIFGPP